MTLIVPRIVIGEVGALAPAMAIPGRNSDAKNMLQPARTFFVTSRTSMSRRLLQSERNATLLIDVLRSLVAERQIVIEDFVIMPDHFHLLLALDERISIEKAMQLIKGRFSRRISHEFGYKGEVWQRGFSELQVLGKESFEKHREYIAHNPVEAGLVREGESFPYCYRTLAEQKIAGAKALTSN